MKQPAPHHPLPSTAPPGWWLTLLTAGTMLAFAANSLLARLALQTTAIDPATFTATRLITGALTLALIVWWQRQRLDTSLTGWLSASLLFIYAAGFSYAYRGLDTGTGALLLFASAQLLMMGYGLVRGERLPPWGLLLALGGLVVFLWPGTAATPPPPSAVALMLCAGLAWGGFSLLGRASQSPVVGTASSFVLAVPFTVALLWAESAPLQAPPLGLLYASVSGCITSALGYVLWYWVRVRMTPTTAGTVQLSVPVLSALMGLALLAETMSLRSALSGAAVLLGVAWTMWAAQQRAKLSHPD